MTEPIAELVPGISIPPQVAQRLINALGRDQALKWVRSIAPIFQEICAKWEIAVHDARPVQSYHIVLFGTSKRAGDVAIKLGPPGGESRAELAATRLASGTGMVRLLDSDPTVSVLLLERIWPGRGLYYAPYSDDDATRVAASQLKAFWRDPVDGQDLISLEHWARELLQFTPRVQTGFPNDLVLSAQAIAQDLLANPLSRSLLHGDMHHQNILWHRRNGWTTIDPKGLIGEKGYDIATWMMNPWGIPHSSGYLQLANRRLDILAECLELDRIRLAQWAVVHAAMSLCWGLDAEQPEDTTGDVTTLRQMMRLLD